MREFTYLDKLIPAKTSVVKYEEQQSLELRSNNSRSISCIKNKDGDQNNVFSPPNNVSGGEGAR